MTHLEMTHKLVTQLMGSNCRTSTVGANQKCIFS